jgi:Glycosyl hydrolases family 2, TIM barrel domain
MAACSWSFAASTTKPTCTSMAAPLPIPRGPRHTPNSRAPNLIRVWGGGIIERPEFYDACDRYGLLVWQEFPFTEDCKQLPIRYYPHDMNPEDFGLFVVCCEDAILMLRNHASLALWVGGNEINPPGGPWPDVPNPPGLNGMLQSLVATYDSKTAYVSSSFDGGLGKSSQILPAAYRLASTQYFCVQSRIRLRRVSCLRIAVPLYVRG